jgi:hypothetical protein
VVNGFATIATGGFSPADTSFGKYPGAAEYAGAMFMLLGSLPYIRFVQMVNGNPGAVWNDVQVRALCRWVAYAVAVVVMWRLATSDQAFEPVLRRHDRRLFRIKLWRAERVSGAGAVRGHRCADSPDPFTAPGVSGAL